jgi:hypothetical protein
VSDALLCGAAKAGPGAVASATVAALSGTGGAICMVGRLRLIFATLRHGPRHIYRRMPV